MLAGWRLTDLEAGRRLAGQMPDNWEADLKLADSGTGSKLGQLASD